MADFGKLRRNLLPPTAAEASANLREPETAPSDGRSERAAGRTYPRAAQHRMKMVEVLEQAFEALGERDRQKSSK